MNSSKYIKKKKIKQVLQKTGGGTGFATELQKKAKWAIRKTLYFHDILGEFCLNAVSTVSNLVAAKFWKGGGV